MTIFGASLSIPRRDNLIRIGVAAGVIVAAGLASYLIVSGRFGLALLVGVIAGVIGLVVLYRLRRFEYGILAIAISAGLFNFFALPTGRESQVPISMAITILLLACWGLQLAFRSRTKIKLTPSPLNKPLLVFVAINIVSYVWALLLRDPILYVWPSFPNVQLAALLVNTGLPLLALLVSNKITDVKWLRYLAWAVVIIGIIAAISDIFVLPTYVLSRVGMRGIFSMWVAGFALSMALYDGRLPRWQRGLLLGVVALWLYQTIGRSPIWLSGWMPMVVSCVIIVFLRSRRLFTATLIIVLSLVVINFSDIYRAVVLSNEEEGSTSRLDIWEMNLAHVANHPFFGMGPAGYAPYNMTYHPEDARSTHNNYFDVLAQTGVFGFVSFAVLMATFLSIGIKTIRMTRGQRTFEEGYAVAAFGGCVGALVAMALGDWILPFAYNQTINGFDNACYTWIFWGGMVSLYLMSKKQEFPASDSVGETHWTESNRGKRPAAATNLE